MTNGFYHILHIAGLLSLFIGFGAVLAGDSKKGMKWHGIGLVIMLVAGFGMLAKLGLMKSMPVWVYVKMGVWLVIGFLPVLSKKQVLSRGVVVLIAALLAAFAASLGYPETRLALGFH
jgi:hypothetical protein